MQISFHLQLPSDQCQGWSTSSVPDHKKSGGHYCSWRPWSRASKHDTPLDLGTVALAQLGYAVNLELDKHTEGNVLCFGEPAHRNRHTIPARECLDRSSHHVATNPGSAGMLHPNEQCQLAVRNRGIAGTWKIQHAYSAVDADGFCRRCQFRVATVSWFTATCRQSLSLQSAHPIPCLLSNQPLRCLRWISGLFKKGRECHSLKLAALLPPAPSPKIVPGMPRESGDVSWGLHPQDYKGAEVTLRGERIWELLSTSFTIPKKKPPFQKSLNFWLWSLWNLSNPLRRSQWC